MWRTEQTRPIVERAAVALAALAFSHVFPNEHLHVARHGDRCDFWLPEMRCGLEVSGTDNPREIRARLREKRTQVLQNSLYWDGFVFLACFHPGKPTILWSFHHQEKAHVRSGKADRESD